MSYRSLKRFLGETSLERKCRFLFGAVLFLLIAGSFYWYGLVTEQLVYKQNQIKGRLLVDTLLTRAHWEKLETDSPSRGLARMLSSDLLLPDYQWRFLKPDQAEWDADLDDWEREVIDAFAQATPPQVRDPTQPDPPAEHDVNRSERFSWDNQWYEYFQAIYATDTTCVHCHRTNRTRDGASEMAVGSLIAVAKIRMPNGPTNRELNINRAILISTAIITVFLAMIAAYVIVRYIIVKPLKHLRDVSDAVSRGEVDQRADIHTGDEFEQLSMAFNRMLRHLVEAQGALQASNVELDTKVDELARLNMQLFESNRLKSDFLATMSHELRTPLNSILGFGEVLASSSALDDKQKRYVHNIQRSGRMLLEMINDLLDLAKIESGKMEVRPVEFRIEQVIGTQVELARPMSERKNIDLEVEIEPDLPPLFQDQPKVQQILNNLLSNAIKFTPEGGRVVIAARRGEGDRLKLVVSDTGVGIDEEEQGIIFEKFRQGRGQGNGPDAMTREHTGTGLGLSIVKELCKLLGGEITLQSELGKGSIFTVTLDWHLYGSAVPSRLLSELETSRSLTASTD